MYFTTFLLVWTPESSTKSHGVILHSHQIIFLMTQAQRLGRMTITFVLVPPIIKIMCFAVSIMSQDIFLRKFLFWVLYVWHDSTMYWTRKYIFLYCYRLQQKTGVKTIYIWKLIWYETQLRRYIPQYFLWHKRWTRLPPRPFQEKFSWFGMFFLSLNAPILSEINIIFACKKP